jgi:hypothetical protein
MPLEPSMRPWRVAGVAMFAIGLAIVGGMVALLASVSGVSDAGPPRAADYASLGLWLLPIAGPFLVVGAMLFGIGLRRRRPR